MGQPTLEVVAARAGVSRATVSRVINGKSTVRPDIRESVQRAVEELDYIPNLAARSLATRRTDAIALVLSEPPSRIFSDEPFFSGVVRGITDELESLQKHLILVLAHATIDRDQVERHIAASQVDGVLVVSTHGDDPLPQALARKGIPVVCSGRARIRRHLSYVDVSNVDGAAAASRPSPGRRTASPASTGSPGTARRCGPSNAVRSSRSASSPATPARSRCANCSTTTRCSTASSSPTT
jgi:DNA-binding LacI/PurR family transcriptional regulator